MNPINSSDISPAELEARLRLHRLPELGPKRFHVLIEAFGCASKALSAPASAWRSLGLPAISAEARRSPKVRDGASEALAWLARPAQHLLMWDQPEYPALLAQIDDAPPLLFVAGDPGILEKPQLAMVGSRRASRPGMDTAAAFSRSLASAGFVITSGLAVGIDGAAHQAALDVGGHTIGVLGTGLENFYPQRHRKLAAAMIAQGSAVVSEFPLDTAPQAGNFPRRNRIISGLSLGVLVVEASMSSGSLFTSRPCSAAKGCHQLIRDGAVLVETIEHILEGLRGWQRLPPAAPVPVTHPLVALLHAAPHSSEALAIASGRPLSQVLATLTELELEGQVICESGRWLARCPLL